jgi:hypothetical protein
LLLGSSGSGAVVRVAVWLLQGSLHGECILCHEHQLFLQAPAQLRNAVTVTANDLAGTAASNSTEARILDELRAKRGKAAVSESAARSQDRGCRTPAVWFRVACVTAASDRSRSLSGPAGFLRVTRAPSSACRNGGPEGCAATVPACAVRLSVALGQAHHFSELPRNGRQQHCAQQAVLLLLD